MEANRVENSRTIAVDCLLLLSSSRVTAADAKALDVANTYAVIVGVLSWEDDGLTPYPTKDRKDQALYDTLSKRGVPGDHIALLLAKEATIG
jgi:hypothetical protein